MVLLSQRKGHSREGIRLSGRCNKARDSQSHSLTVSPQEGGGGGAGWFSVRKVAPVAAGRRFHEGFEEFAHEGGCGEVAARGAEARVAVDFVGNAHVVSAHGISSLNLIVRRRAVIFCKTAVSISGQPGERGVLLGKSADERKWVSA